MVITCKGCNARLDGTRLSVFVLAGRLSIKCPACEYVTGIQVEGGGLGHVEMAND